MTNSIKKSLYDSSDDPKIRGFQEIIISVSNLNRSVDFYQKVCGWELICQYKGGDDLKQLWHLDIAVDIEIAVLRNPGDTQGFLRIVQFNNVEQQQIRAGTHIWDSGGLFDFNIRTKNIEKLHFAFQQEGWNGCSEIVRFEFGIYDVSEVLMKGPDGIVIAIIQRNAPPLEGYPHLKKTSQVFNASVISKNMKATYDFFVNQLEFQMVFQTDGTGRKGRENVMGFPPNINENITLPVKIVSPDKSSVGSIEFMKPIELSGRDCTHLAKPPNLGVLMLRFPVKNVAKYAAKLKERGVHLNSELQTIEIPPYGGVNVFSVLSPDGVWIEFIGLK